MDKDETNQFNKINAKKISVIQGEIEQIVDDKNFDARAEYELTLESEELNKQLEQKPQEEKTQEETPVELKKNTSPTNEKYGTINRNDGKGVVNLTKEEFEAEQANMQPKAEGAVDIESKRIETEGKIKNKNLFLAEVDENGNKVIDKETGEASKSVGEIISQSDVAPVPTSVKEVNGIEFVEFSNPKTGDVDVIVTGKNDGSYVGYYRLYDENGKPTNKWSSKFENPSRNKEDFKTMIGGVQEMLPQGHEYTEKNSLFLVNFTTLAIFSSN
jgi:hypothetical protein